MYDRFVQLLQEYNVTPYRVSKETGVGQSSLTDWKTGRATPKTDKLQKIADYFNVSLDWLIGKSDFKNVEDAAKSYFNEYKEEIILDFKNSGKVVPKAMQIEVDQNGELNQKLEYAKKILTMYPKNEEARKKANELLKEVRTELGHDSDLDFTYSNILLDLDSLNVKGLRKVLGLTHDLVLIKDYLRDSSNEPELVAAHARTDIETTPEGQAHDMAIMDDDSEWE